MTQYAIRECAEDTARNGPYLRLTLSNKAGTVKAVYWQVPDAVKAVAKVGAVVEVEGRMEEYRGEPQLNITALAPVPESEAQFEVLLPVSPYDRARQRQRLVELIEGVRSEAVRGFLQRTFAQGESFWCQYTTWPASVTYHHAWVGGLLDHSLEVAETALTIGRRWANLTNPDILAAGALLHYVGKLAEIRVGATFEFTDQGRLLGHLALGIDWLRSKAGIYELMPSACDELQHIIASHHGSREWGALVEPKTANAVAIHLADLTSARMEMVRAAVTGHTGDEPWTAYDKATKTQYFVPAS